MLNECLKKDQSKEIDIRNCSGHVGNTGIAPEDSANLGPRRLAKQRFQRMRRRHERSAFSASAPTGWMARML
jgi:hypothetical protein